MTALRGVQAIHNVFERAQADGRAVLIPYLTMGYPTPERSIALAEAAIEGGADLLELGIPFSDPLADGPAIQRATHCALQQGTTAQMCIDLAAELRRRHPETPLLFMGYVNPILAYGERTFCQACQDAGVDGLIVPDLPIGEAGLLDEHCRAHDLALVLLAAPNTPDDRLRAIGERSTGYVYLVSITGITGARDSVPEGLAAFVERSRHVIDQPLAVGFGIASAESASAVGRLADGVIVGSAVVERCAEDDAEERVASFVAELRAALG